MSYTIEHVAIGKISLNPSNPRFIKDDAFQRLVKSLQDCPQLLEARPLICSDRTGKLVCLGGNMRYRAAKQLKYKDVPAIIMAGLTEDQEREIAIKDNGSFGDWDYEALANEWSDLPLAEWGIDDDFGCLGGCDEEKLIQEEKEIRPYTKVHILISAELSAVDEIEEMINALRKIPGVDIEQAAN